MIRLHSSVGPGLAVLLLLLAGCRGTPTETPVEDSAEVTDPLLTLDDERDDEPAPWTPVQLGLYEQFQIFGNDHDVFGLRLSLVSSRNARVVGLDLGGFLSRSEADSGGIQASLCGNAVDGDFVGLQFAGLSANRAGRVTTEGMHAEDMVYGAQVAFLGNFGNVCGIQVGLINGLEFKRASDGEKKPGLESARSYFEQDLFGILLKVVLGDIAGKNDFSGSLRGAQLGMANWSRDAVGTQVGLRADADHLSGIQLGAIRAATGELNGLQFGLLTSGGDAHGLQASLYGGAEGLDGLQLGGWCQASDVRGLQVAAISRADRIRGLQFGLYNGGRHHALASVHGSQVGVFNMGDTLSGLQLGAVNVTKRLEGLQIGLWNVSPNGFFPAFPLFNFAW